MRPRELLKSSSPSFGRSGDWVVNWGSLCPPASPSALGLGWTPDGGGTCEGTPTLKSVKRVVSSQSDKWHTLLLGMRTIYIILVGLPCWAHLSGGHLLGLHYLILNDRLTSLILVWALTSAKSSWHGSAIGHVPVVSVVSAKSSKVSTTRASLLRSRPLGRFGLSAKSSKVSAPRASLLRSRPGLPRSRPLGQVFQGLDLSAIPVQCQKFYKFKSLSYWLN